MLWALAIGGNTELLPTLYRHFQIGEANPYARIAPESIPFAAAHWDINDVLELDAYARARAASLR